MSKKKPAIRFDYYPNIDAQYLAINQIKEKVCAHYGEKFINRANGHYFIFDEPIGDFELWCTPGWLFRIWLYDHTKPDDYLILGEYYDAIDKFKPGRVTLEVNSVEKFIEQVKIIMEQPLQAKAAALEGLPLDFPAWHILNAKEEYIEGYQVKMVKKDDNMYHPVRDESITKEAAIRRSVTQHYQYKRWKQRVSNICWDLLMHELLPQVLNANPYIEITGVRNHGKNWSPRYDLLVGVQNNRFKMTYDEDTANFNKIFEALDKICDDYNEKLEKLSEDPKYMGDYDNEDDIGVNTYDYRIDSPFKVFTPTQVMMNASGGFISKRDYVADRVAHAHKHGLRKVQVIKAKRRS